MKTIPLPNRADELAIYEGIKKWFSAAYDRTSGEIEDNSTIPTSCCWSWMQLDSLLKDASNGRCSIFSIRESCQTFSSDFRPAITITEVLECFLCEVVSGASVGEDQHELWWETLVDTAARIYNISKAEAPKFDLRTGGDYQLRRLNLAFCKATGVGGFDFSRYVGDCDAHTVMRARDLLSVIAQALEEGRLSPGALVSKT